MAINLNKPEDNNGETSNPNTSSQGGLDSSKLNFKKDPISGSKTETASDHLDTKKINFNKEPLSKTEVENKSLGNPGLDKSKLKFTKDALPASQPKDKGDEKIDSIAPSTSSDELKGKKGSKTWLVVAALLIVGGLIWFFTGKTPTTNQQSSNIDAAKPVEGTQGTASDSVPGNSTGESEPTASEIPPVGATNQESNSGNAIGTDVAANPGAKISGTVKNQGQPTSESSSAASQSVGSNAGSIPQNAVSTISNDGLTKARQNSSSKSTQVEGVQSSGRKSDKSQTTTSGNRPLTQGLVDASSGNALNSTTAAIFGLGSLEISSLNESLIQEVIRKMNAEKNLKLLVNGYASSEGPLDLNVRLSKERADAFRLTLISRGVASDRVDAIGRGIENPIGDNSTLEGRQKNRRVELDFR